jgi:hypothetical protein
MPTGDQFVHLVNKKLLGVSSFADFFLNYVRSTFTSFVAAVYNKDGTYGETRLAITGTGSALSIADGTGTDGSGHLLVVGSGEKDLPWPDDGDTYQVALHYDERPVGVQVNPRTGFPEYQNWQEVVGIRGVPDTVTVVSGHLRVDVSSLLQSKVSFAGRTCLLWLTTPNGGALTEEIAIEERTIQWDSGSLTNFIDTVGLLGSVLGETNEALYQALILGPTFRSDNDLESADGYWFIGEVYGTSSLTADVSGQRLITKSLSDLLEYLVYSNVVNTFTTTQRFEPLSVVPGVRAQGLAIGSSASYAIEAYGASITDAVAEAAIYALGGGAGSEVAPGVVAIGGAGATGAPGIRATGGNGTSSYGGSGGEFQGTGVMALGIKATGGAEGRGGEFYGGSGAAAGVHGEGGLNGGAGVEGYGGTNYGPGGIFTARASNSQGVQGYGYGSGQGLAGIGGNNLSGKGAAGVYGVGGTGSTDGGAGVEGLGTGTGEGGAFHGGVTAGTGVKATSGANGYGVDAVASGATGVALRGRNVDGVAVYGYGLIGVSAVGHAAGIGLMVEGGADAPAIQIVPISSTPSSAINGSLWFDSTNGLCLRVGGANYRVNITAL